MQVGKLTVKIGADTSDLGRGIKQATGQLQAAGRKMKRVGSALTQYVTLPLGLLGGASLKAAADFEKLEKGLTAAMGSAGAAKKEISKLKEAAQRPGLGFKQAVRGSLNLQAVGLSAQESRQALAQFGNAIALAGGSADDLNGVSRALQQIISKGKVSAEEINQLAERVPQVRMAIENAFGTANTEKIQNMNVEAEEFVNTIVGQLGELKRAEGGLANAFTNIGIAAQTALKTIGDSINEAFGVQSLVERFTGYLSAATDWFAALSPQVQRVVVSVAGLAAAAGPVLFALGTLSTTVLPAVAAGFSALLGPVGAVVAAVGVAGAAGVALYNNWGQVSSYLSKQFPGALTAAKAALQGLLAGAKEVFSTIVAVARPLMGDLVELVAVIVARVGELWRTFGDEIIAVTRWAFGWLVGGVKTYLQNIGDAIGFWLNLLTGDWGEAWQNIADITRRTFGPAINFMIGALARGLRALSSFAEEVLSKMSKIAEVIALVNPAASRLATGLLAAGAQATGFSAEVLEGMKLDLASAKQKGSDTGKAFLEGMQSMFSGGWGPPGAEPPPPPPNTGPGGGDGLAGDGLPAVDAAGLQIPQVQIADIQSMVPSGAASDALDMAAQGWWNLAKTMGATVPQIKQNGIEGTQALQKSAKEMERMSRQISSAVGQAVNQMATTVFQGFGGIFANAFGFMTAEQERVQSKIKDTQAQISQAMASGAGKGSEEVLRLQNRLKALREEASRVGPSFANIGRSLLKTLADLAVKVGTIVLTTGAAIEAIRTALTSLFGIPAIAAGAALIALGSGAKIALSNAASGGGGRSYAPREPVRYSANANAVTGGAGSTASPPPSDGGNQPAPVNVIVEPRVTSGGNLEWSTRETRRRFDRYGTPDL